jgi:hypothetical protein
LKKRWCIIHSVGARFGWLMEGVLDLYEEPHDEKRPAVCFDELSWRLVAEKRALACRIQVPRATITSTSVRGRPTYARSSSRRRAGGTWTLPSRAQRQISSTRCGGLAEEHYPKAEKVRVVLDNRNTHRGAALYGVFEPTEARRHLLRLEFYHTPKDTRPGSSK